MSLTHLCPQCDTIADRPKNDPVNIVTSCACGAYQLIQFTDPAQQIRDGLDRAEAKFPSNQFLASLRAQFETRRTLSVAQLERLRGMAGPKENA